MDRATHGHPGKYTYCIAENESQSPWDPFHVSRGFDADESTVTVVGAEAPHEINDHISTDAAGILTMASDVLATLGNNHLHHTNGEVCLVLGPEHADTIAKDGWSREDVRWFIYDQARNKLETLQALSLVDEYTWHRRFEFKDPESRLPLVESPEDVLVLVAGGAGKHSMAIHSFGETRSVTKTIETQA